MSSPKLMPPSVDRMFRAIELVHQRLGRAVTAPGVGKYQVIGLSELVTMKLALLRTIDCVHIRDMIDIGLIDATRLSRLPPDLAARLQQLLDTPNG